MKDYSKDEKIWMIVMGSAIVIVAIIFVHILIGFVNLIF